MSTNTKSLLSLITFPIEKETFNSYYQNIFPFLTLKTTGEISYFPFHNYFSLCPFLSSKVFHLFTQFSETPRAKTLSEKAFLRGMHNLYTSDLRTKIKTIFQLFDFDSDGVIKFSDVKLLTTHFHHFSSNKSKIELLYEEIEKFFNSQSEDENNVMHNKTMNFETFEFIVMKKNSDLFFLFLFFVYKHAPFCMDEIDFFDNCFDKTKKDNDHLFHLSDIENESESELYEPSHFVFNYLNENYKCDLKYECKAESDLDDDFDDLEELAKIEEDLSIIKNESMLTSASLTRSASGSDGADYNRPVSKTEKFTLLSPPLFKSEKKENRSTRNLIFYKPVRDESKFLSPNFVDKKSKFEARDDIEVVFKNKSSFHSLAYIAFEEDICDKCNIYVFGKMLFIMKPQITTSSSRSTYLIPIKQLYINKTKKGKVTTTLIKTDTLNEMYSVKVISGLNNFISFSLSFTTEYLANKFISTIETAMKFKDIKNDFTFGKVVGEGGFAKIKKVTHNRSKKAYAVKILKKFTNKDIKCIDDIEGFNFITSEIDVCKTLVHVSNEHIVNIKAIYETFEKIYIIMDYVESGTLDCVLQKKFNTLTTETKFDIANRLVKAVIFLHSYSIMHRDIKASNVLIDKDNKIYLIDFGLAYIIGDNEYTKGSYGTVSYAPPEMYQDKHYNSSIDIWSLGVVLYYLLYGELPFDCCGEDEVREVVRNIFNLKIRFYELDASSEKEKEMQDKMVKVIKMCLVRDAKKRPRAIELLKVLSM